MQNPRAAAKRRTGSRCGVGAGLVRGVQLTRALRWRTADSMPQRRFARQINGASLLNYGTLDGSFTAAGVLPPCTGDISA